MLGNCFQGCYRSKGDHFYYCNHTVKLHETLDIVSVVSATGFCKLWLSPSLQCPNVLNLQPIQNGSVCVGGAQTSGEWTVDSTAQHNICPVFT